MSPEQGLGNNFYKLINRTLIMFYKKTSHILIWPTWLTWPFCKITVTTRINTITYRIQAHKAKLTNSILETVKSSFSFFPMSINLTNAASDMTGYTYKSHVDNRQSMSSDSNGSPWSLRAKRSRIMIEHRCGENSFKTLNVQCLGSEFLQASVSYAQLHYC